jgi:hypothetical protein
MHDSKYFCNHFFATEMDYPAFNPENYKIDFPLFVPNVDEYLQEVARDDAFGENQ